MAFELPCSFCFDEKHVLTRLGIRDVKHDPCVRERESSVCSGCLLPRTIQSCVFLFPTPSPGILLRLKAVFWY